MSRARKDDHLRSPWRRSFEVASFVLTAAIAGCGGGTSSGTSSGTPGASAAITAGHPLVGTWTVEVTRADLAAGGVSDPGLQNENAGRFTWTFAPDGSWTSIQQSLDGAPIANPVFRGTYEIEGETLVATTAFPEQFADQGLRYTWVASGDEVRFDLLDAPDPILPIIVESHPWKRSG